MGTIGTRPVLSFSARVDLETPAWQVDPALLQLVAIRVTG
jgi:hypothetical protein